MKTYKTPARQRKRMLEYYYQHREEILEQSRLARRARGVKQRGGWNRLTPEQKEARDRERLAAIVLCRDCESQITTPSRLLQGRTTCLRCEKKVYREQGSTARSQKAYRKRATSTVERVAAVKRAGKCRGCGARGPLDFHHRDPATKEFKVSRGRYQYSWERVRAEIAKCDLLCKECHRKKHGG